MPAEKRQRPSARARTRPPALEVIKRKGLKLGDWLRCKTWTRPKRLATIDFETGEIRLDMTGNIYLSRTPPMGTLPAGVRVDERLTALERLRDQVDRAYRDLAFAGELGDLSRLHAAAVAFAEVSHAG